MINLFFEKPKYRFLLGAVIIAIIYLLWHHGFIFRILPYSWKARCIVNASRNGDIRRVRMLVTADKRLVNAHSMNWSPLQIAAITGHCSVAEYLLNNGADINAKGGEWSQTPLSYAVFYNDENMITLLLDHGANPNITGRDGRTPLYIAHSGYVCSLLLDKGANLHFASGDDLSPFHAAICFSNEEIVSVMLRYVNDTINTKDPSNGNTALHYAAMENNERIIELLLTNKADLTAENYLDETPLDIAKSRGNDAAVKLLRRVNRDKSLIDK